MLQMQEEALAAASRSVEALQAAVAGSMNVGSMDSADQMEEDEEIDDEIDPDDEEEELASRQPTVHDVHVGGESALTAGVSGRDTLPNAPRSVDNLHGLTWCVLHALLQLLLAI
jgi:hypothetical protein